MSCNLLAGRVQAGVTGTGANNQMDSACLAVRGWCCKLGGNIHADRFQAGVRGKCANSHGDSARLAFRAGGAATFAWTGRLRMLEGYALRCGAEQHCL